MPQILNDVLVGFGCLWLLSAGVTIYGIAVGRIVYEADDEG